MGCVFLREVRWINRIPVVGAHYWDPADEDKKIFFVFSLVLVADPAKPAKAEAEYLSVLKFKNTKISFRPYVRSLYLLINLNL